MATSRFGLAQSFKSALAFFLAVLLIPQMGLASTASPSVGINTSSGTTDLPFSIANTQVLDLTTSGFTFSNGTGITANGVMPFNYGTTPLMNLSSSGVTFVSGFGITGNAATFDTNSLSTIHSLETAATCTTGQALFKTGPNSFSCGSFVQLDNSTGSMGFATLTNCGSGSVLTSNGNNFSCANSASSTAFGPPTPNSCTSPNVLTSNGTGGFSCVSPSSLATAPVSSPCSAGYVLTYTSSGYSCVQQTAAAPGIPTTCSQSGGYNVALAPNSTGTGFSCDNNILATNIQASNLGVTGIAAGTISSGSITDTGSFSATSISDSGALSVIGNTILGNGSSNTTTINGSASVSGALSAAGITDSGALSAVNITDTGNTALSTLTVSGISRLTGATIIGSAFSPSSLTVNGTASVTGNTTLGSGASNTTTINGSASISGSASVTGNISVGGQTLSASDVTLLNSLATAINGCTGTLQVTAGVISCGAATGGSGTYTPIVNASTTFTGDLNITNTSGNPIFVTTIGAGGQGSDTMYDLTTGTAQRYQVAEGSPPTMTTVVPGSVHSLVVVSNYGHFDNVLVGVLGSAGTPTLTAGGSGAVSPASQRLSGSFVNTAATITATSGAGSIAVTSGWAGCSGTGTGAAVTWDSGQCGGNVSASGAVVNPGGSGSASSVDCNNNPNGSASFICSAGTWVLQAGSSCVPAYCALPN